MSAMPAGELPRAIYLYDEGTCPSLDVAELGGRLSVATGARLEVAGEFVGSVTGPSVLRGGVATLAKRIACLRVTHWNRPQCRESPFALEIEVERRGLLSGEPPVGVAYDGARMLWLFEELLSSEQIPDGLHIAFTRRLLATWDHGDRRWHARAAIYGEPCVISTTGLVQAPARPREYYRAHAQLGRLAPQDVVSARLERELAGRILTPDDPRMTDVCEGYALQCVFFQMTGWPFCDNPDCRLFNAHWQTELVHAQLRDGAGLCGPHQEALRGARERNLGCDGRS